MCTPARLIALLFRILFRAEEARLERNIADLVRRGGEVEVINCTVQGGGLRPCVRTDERGYPNPLRRDSPETFRLIERR